MTDNGSKPADNFPVDSFKEAASHLRRPFSVDAVHFKVESQWPRGKQGEKPPPPKGGLLVAYIDARLVIERLNLTLPHLWETSFQHYGGRIDTNKVICHLTVDGLTRSDVGSAAGGFADAAKGAYSDALKRAAVHFGIGVSLYALPKWKLNAKKGGGEDSEGKPLLFVNDRNKIDFTPRVDKWLRERYAEWLADHGKGVFGEPLDHGDVEGSVGVALESGEIPLEDEEREPDTLELAAKRQQAEDLYKSLAAKQRPNLPPGRFNARLNGSESVEQLDKLVSEVKELAAA